MTHPNAARRGLLAIAVLAALLAPVAVAEAITLPSGFADEQVMTIDSPMALAFTPDGRMLIAAKHGTLHVYTTSGALKTALDLTAKACTNIERGVLGVAVDPAFATNHYVYLFYTLNKFNNSCPVSAAQTPVGRVSRFVLGNDNIVSAASETVLIDNIPSYGGHHDAGDVQFGKDGNLYVSTGDGYCDYAGGGCEGLNDASRDEHVLVGKILRITPSGAIPPDNPFTGLGTARCNLAGRTNPGMRCQETYAWGLRNPFRIAFDPNAAGTRLYIDDVGQAVWDEIDEGVAGADYGWNTREGHCANGSSTDCGAPPAGMTNPIFDYGHGDLCSSITGGAFVPNDAWPPPYAGTYLFGDYACGKIFQLVPKAGGGFERLEFVSGLGANSAVHLTFGPDGALYYTNFVGTGTIHRIVRNTGNRPPIADLAATPTSGATPLTVSFDASLSSDPDAGDALTYLWDFGDATPATQTSVPTTSHAYTTAGTFTATLTVRDDHALASAPDTLRIDPGNDPPVVTIGSPSSGQRAAVGDTILLRGGATDPQDGALPDSALSWTVIRHHASHTHPFLGPVGGNAQSFVAPPPEDLSATTNSSLEVRLTATDSHGVTSTAARTVAPKLVDLAFASNPTGLSLLLDGFTFTAPRTWTSWEGWDVVAGAPSQGSFAFGSWSDGGAGT
ncbi:MAG: hypothetical protein QOG56_2823, partial [Solirubrobacteraceae bacterium]|nr:hypothetical protein [Solirubrobacteraceae bacterium]